MKAFEYKRIKVTSETMEQVLNSHGVSGWEAVNVVVLEGEVSRSMFVLMKRELKSGFDSC